MAELQRPLDALNNARNKRILVAMKNGKEITGLLQAFDIHLNIVLINAEENSDDKIRKLGTVLVRGDTILFISPSL